MKPSCDGRYLEEGESRGWPGASVILDGGSNVGDLPSALSVGVEATEVAVGVRRCRAARAVRLTLYI
ncbi:hypothetical protein GUJ93_ZPchr0006g44802 [Zizania palustris]|uniref:Uncharacterized protein n=1 Tax=Zizania palustris TaxID=103762 RepID=A0A8J5T701_ZIZPA|nr:hypothetical protein GUJ93_ZPchr0006g44802 [Zizania palustris]